MESLRLTGRETVFGKHLAERLERVGIITDNVDGLHIVCSSNENTIECDILIRPSQSKPPTTQVGCEIVIHDMYIPSGSYDWGPNEIEKHLEWLVNSSGEPPYGQPRHWVHVRDVVDMFVLLLDKPPLGRIDVCGRRCWDHGTMSSELGMLYSRFKAAENNNIQLENVKIFEPNIKSTVTQERPDLNPIHSALQEVGAAGWHPLVPFRLGLMECMAYYLG